MKNYTGESSDIPVVMVESMEFWLYSANMGKNDRSPAGAWLFARDVMQTIGHIYSSHPAAQFSDGQNAVSNKLTAFNPSWYIAPSKFRLVCLLNGLS
jgi:hypothetical protein